MKQEWQAVKELWENKELSIRKVDKGGKIILLNTSDYNDRKIGDIVKLNECILLNKNHTSQIERMDQKCLVTYKMCVPCKMAYHVT